jgi:hypothetical protein
MSSYLFWRTISSHIKELTSEDVEYIEKNFKPSDNEQFSSYVSREYNINFSMLKIALLEISPPLRYLLHRIDYEFNLNDFHYLLFAVANYIFSTWAVEIHNVLGNCQISTDETSDDFGDIELF